MKNLAAAFFLCLALSAATRAAVVYVNADTTGANDGSSWPGATIFGLRPWPFRDAPRGERRGLPTKERGKR